LSAAILAVVFLLAGLVLSVKFEWQFSQSVGAIGFAVLVVSHAVARWVV
jgi:hypothetical protein